MSAPRDFDVVTGAFGYTGKYITRRLLAEGRNVRTITGHPDLPNPFNGLVAAAPMDFRDPPGLVRSLCGARVLFNTYWVRFPHGEATFAQAVANSKILFRAAKEAGIERIVHLSIANPALDSPFAYYSGKAQVERDLAGSGVSYAILRPTVIFGPEDILINNIAWFLRRLPVFGIPGDGNYLIQPIFVEDLADLAVRVAGFLDKPAESNLAGPRDNLIRDAVGPETFTFEQLVRLIASEIGRRPLLAHSAPRITLVLLRLLDPFVRDRILTREEIYALMANLLVSTEVPLGRTRFTEWLAANRATLGSRYASELTRHFSR
jgi:NADH dehydrogenase